MKIISFTFCILFSACLLFAQNGGVREYGIRIGSKSVGTYNAITDVKGVKIGHTTLIKGTNVRTGVTAILPHVGNLFMNKVPAAVYTGNGFGKLAGSTQVQELGNIETPIILTNTLSVPTAADALIDHALSVEENEQVLRSVNPVVGETNDGTLNDIQGRHVTKSHVLEAIRAASPGPVEQGSVGAGTGTICFNYKGGIGSSSRVLSKEQGGFTVGVLVQTNFGGNLTIAGVPVKEELNALKGKESGDGSIIVVIATDAPLTSRNLERLAKRAMFGIARTGGNCSNGSGEYVIAFSTAEHLRIPHRAPDLELLKNLELRNDAMTPLFEAVMEATEEAILNSLFRSVSVSGFEGSSIERLPVNEVVKIVKAHGMIGK